MLFQLSEIAEGRVVLRFCLDVLRQPEATHDPEFAQALVERLAKQVQLNASVRVEYWIKGDDHCFKFRWKVRGEWWSNLYVWTVAGDFLATVGMEEVVSHLADHWPSRFVDSNDNDF